MAYEHLLVTFSPHETNADLWWFAGVGAKMTFRGWRGGRGGNRDE